VGVSAVIRLNEKQYNEGDFIKAGINHYDLYFDDCTTPPEDIVIKFFKVSTPPQKKPRPQASNLKI
jgi:cell division cycle 14